MAEEVNQQRTCPKDCRKCNISQQVYCSTSLAFNSYELISRVLTRLEHVEERLSTFQGTENELLTPISEDKPARAKE